jgi:flagellar biosynthetic protein FliR
LPELRQHLHRLFDPANVLLLTLVMARVGGLVMLAPVYGGRDVPLKFRAALALAIALLVAPLQLASSPPDPGTLLNFLCLAAADALVGLVLGLGVWIFLSGMQLAGQLIGSVSGLSLATVVDPQSGESVPVTSHLLYGFAIVVFLCLGGHRLVMQALLESFSTLPVGRAPLAWLGVEPLTAMLSGSFELGLRVAAPVTVAVLAATLAVAFISRAAPQLNALVVGLGLNSLLTFAVLALSLGGAAWALEDQIEPVMEVLRDAVSNPAHDS